MATVLVGLLGCLLAAFAGPPGVTAQSEVDPVEWSFFHNLGYGDAVGDFDDALEQLWMGEFGLRRESGGWRYGLGVSFGSFAQKEPYQDELEFGLQRIFVSAARVFSPGSAFRPYLEGRLGIARMHPRSELFAYDPLPDDFEIGDSPTPPTNGFHVGLVPGFEWRFSRSLALDVSAMADFFRVSDTDLGPVGGAVGNASFDWGVRLGLAWLTGPGPRPRPLDPWGVRPSLAWGFGEALSINYVASAANEYVRNKNFNQISPRSWWSNIEDGFTYDDNEFSNNQFIHPFNGSQYFNAGRANALGFWTSAGIALIGAFHWELAGETHPMSLNDLVATGVGGIAVGEAQYRFSSMILDNQDRGFTRGLREAAGFLVDPIRGFNRVVSGRVADVRPNPAEPMDAKPLGALSATSVGLRRIGERKSLTEDTEDNLFVEFRHRHGSVFDNPRRGAFDYFEFEGQLNFGDKTAIARLFIRGNLLTVPVGESERPNHMLALMQHFTYDNHNAYEYGGQSLGLGLFSRWGGPGPIGFVTQGHLLATLMGAVNSDASELADVADQERIREYDYGPGAGGNALLRITWNELPVFSLRYQLHFLYVLNGSVYHKDPSVGLDATHWLHGVDARLDLPVWRGLAAGVRFSSFTRESHYDISIPEELPEGATISQLIKQTNPELRIYLTWAPGIG